MGTTVTAETFSARFPGLCAALSGDDLAALLDALEVQEVLAGEALIGEGTTTDALFLVWEGELDVSMDTPYGPREISHVGAGSYLGEVSLLDPGPATATVTAESGCVALRLSRAAFDDLCTSRPKLASVVLDGMLATLGRRVRAGTERLDSQTEDRSGSLRPDDLVGVHGLLYEGSGR